MIYAHVYWCLSDGSSHWLLSSTISSQMNHEWTNWGMSLQICDIYWGYASLWTSLLASHCNEGKTDGARSWHVWTLKHLGFMVLFMLFCTFGLHLVQRLWHGPLLSFRMLNIYCHNVILNLCKLSCPSPTPSVLWAFWIIICWPLQSCWYTTSSWGSLDVLLSNHAPQLLAVNSIWL